VNVNVRADRRLTELLSEKMGGSIQPALEQWGRNETRARTMEGDDEKFVTWVKKLLAAEREDETVF